MISTWQWILSLVGRMLWERASAYRIGDGSEIGLKAVGEAVERSGSDGEDAAGSGVSLAAPFMLSIKCLRLI